MPEFGLVRRKVLVDFIRDNPVYHATKGVTVLSVAGREVIKTVDIYCHHADITSWR
jgi:hypothetical protein